MVGKSCSFDRDAAVRMYIETGSSPKVAEVFGVNQGTIINELKRRGIARWSKGVGRKDVVPVPENPAVLAYIAGMIDGDGTLTIVEDRRGKNITYRTELFIFNNSTILMAWLEQFGGKTHWHWRTNYNRDGYNRQPQAQWMIRDSISVHAWLTALLPYLVIKRDKAMEMIGLLERQHPHLARRGLPIESVPYIERNGNAKLTEDDVRTIRSSELSGLELAALYHVTPHNISLIRTRKSWKHVI